jgi:hypothetical protein
MGKESNKKETAVDYIKRKLTSGDIFSLTVVLHEAKQLERNQHGDTWDAAIQAHEDRGHVLVRSICDFDDYFNETYD